MALKMSFDLEYLMDDEMAMNLDPYWDRHLDSLMGQMMDTSLDMNLV